MTSRTGQCMISRTACLLIAAVALIGAATADAQAGPRRFAPMAPPLGPAAPLSSPQDPISPLLLQPGPSLTLPSRPAPSYPALQAPSPIDQQQMRTYRNELYARQRALELQGVSPADEQMRALHSELGRLNGG